MGNLHKSSLNDNRSNSQKTRPTKEEQFSSKKIKNEPSKDPKDVDHDSQGRPNSPFS